ncbi:MAG: hypothetical protein Q8S01_06340, partial [Ignavibacteria bacterium]|nr:hypothetical protein [Ignavibacteria bacterium]
MGLLPGIGMLAYKAAAPGVDGKYQTAGAYGGYLYRSIDYGVNWSQVGVSAYWNGIAISSNGQYQTAVVVNGLTYRSADYGATWAYV